MINNNFTFKLFSSDKFGFVSNIWACLSANITIHICHNVVIGIVNEPRKLRHPDILEFTLFSFRTQTFISISSYTSVDVASGRPVSFSVDSTGLFLAKNFVRRFRFLLIVVTCKHQMSGLDINVCPIPVKTDVGQVDLVLRLSDGTSEKNPEIPKRAGTTDKSISTGIKYWVCCMKEPCLISNLSIIYFD